MIERKLELFTIPELDETWVYRCGRPPQSSKCQWQTWTHWCWPESLLSALCQNWMGRSSCCSYPLIKNQNDECNNRINSHFHWQQFAVVFVWFINTIWRLVTSAENRVYLVANSKAVIFTQVFIPLFETKEDHTAAPCRYTGRHCRWTRPPSRWTAWSTSPAGDMITWWHDLVWSSEQDNMMTWCLDGLNILVGYCLTLDCPTPTWHLSSRTSEKSMLCTP